jgi:hypothetical protein
MPLNHFTLAVAGVEIRVDQAKFDKGMTRAQKSIKKLQVGLESLARKAKWAFLAMGTAMAGFVKVAANAEETMNKFNAVFEDQASGVRKWSKNFGAAVGRSQVELQDFLSQFQNLFVAMGFSGKGAAEFSKRLTKLTVDLASFHNEAEREVATRLFSGLVGEAEAVRRLGADISAVRVEQQLGAASMRKYANESEHVRKVIARLQLILEASVKAENDAFNTRESATNQFKRVKAAAADLAAQFGERLIPHVKKLTTNLLSMLDALEKLPSGVKDNVVQWGLWGTAITGVLAILPKVLASVGLLLGTAAGRGILALTAAIGLLGKAFVKAGKDGTGFSGVLKSIADDLESLFDVIPRGNKEIFGIKNGTVDFNAPYKGAGAASPPLADIPGAKTPGSIEGLRLSHFEAQKRRGKAEIAFKEAKDRQRDFMEEIGAWPGAKGRKDKGGGRIKEAASLKRRVDYAKAVADAKAELASAQRSEEFRGDRWRAAKRAKMLAGPEGMGDRIARARAMGAAAHDKFTTDKAFRREEKLMFATMGADRPPAMSGVLSAIVKSLMGGAGAALGKAPAPKAAGPDVRSQTVGFTQLQTFYQQQQRKQDKALKVAEEHKKVAKEHLDEAKDFAKNLAREVKEFLGLQ